MTDHACPFCGAKLDVAAVPPGKPFRCGGCNVALDAGETRLSADEARAYRSRQLVRRIAFCVVAAGVAALAAFLSGTQVAATSVAALAAATAAVVACGVLLAVLARRPAPVPVAPVADKVQG